MLSERAAQQLLDVEDHVVDIDDLGLNDLAAREREQLMGEVRSALPGEADLLDVFARAPPAFVAVDPQRRVEVVRDEGRVVDDHREQVVEVVGDASRQLAEALQPLRLVQLVVKPLPLCIGLQALALVRRHHPLAHVADGGDGEYPTVCLDTGQADLRGKLAAIPAPPKQLQAGAHRPCTRIGEIPGSMGAVRSAEALGHQHLDRLAQQLVARIPEQHLDLRVDEHDQPLATDSHHRVGGQIDQRDMRRKLSRPRPQLDPAGTSAPRSLASILLTGIPHPDPFPSSQCSAILLDMRELQSSVGDIRQAQIVKNAIYLSAHRGISLIRPSYRRGP